MLEPGAASWGHKAARNPISLIFAREGNSGLQPCRKVRGGTLGVLCRHGSTGGQEQAAASTAGIGRSDQSLREDNVAHKAGGEKASSYLRVRRGLAG